MHKLILIGALSKVQWFQMQSPSKSLLNPLLLDTNLRQMSSAILMVVDAKIVTACGEFVTVDPTHQRQTQISSKKEIKDSSRNQDSQSESPAGFKPKTP